MKIVKTSWAVRNICVEGVLGGVWVALKGQAYLDKKTLNDGGSASQGCSDR